MKPPYRQPGRIGFGFCCFMAPVKTGSMATVDQLAGSPLVVDLQDTGSRYYTYVTTVFLP